MILSEVGSGLEGRVCFRTDLGLNLCYAVQ